MFRRISVVSKQFFHHTQWTHGNKLSSVNSVNGNRLYSKQANIQNWIDSLDDERKKKIHLIQNELIVSGLEKREVPKVEYLSRDDYEELLQKSSNQRYKFYSYLHNQYSRAEQEKIKSIIRKALVEDNKRKRELEPKDNLHIQYGLGKGSLILKVYPRLIDKWKNHKVYGRMVLNDSKLIFDCSFSHSMNSFECKNTAKQITRCIGLNRGHPLPYVIHLCGLNVKSSFYHYLKRHIPTIGVKSTPFCVHEEQPHEVIPKDKLVYLTPDSDVLLEKYNSEDSYVIGGIVDRGSQIPLMLAKAKELGIRTARLPLERYRTMRSSKVLTLDSITNIMLDVRHHGKWNEAFRHIASRKFY